MSLGGNNFGLGLGIGNTIYGGGGGGGGSSFLLQETLFNLLQEDLSPILIEVSNFVLQEDLFYALQEDGSLIQQG